jgi:peptidoglycan DL-endopeptidase CwlO
MRHPTHRPLAAIAAVAIALAFAVSTASASPAAVRAKKAEVARLQAQLDAIGDRVSDSAERYNGARWRLGQIQQRLVVNQQTLAKAIGDLTTAERVLAERLDALYRRPDPALVEILLSQRSLTAAVAEAGALERAGGGDARLVSRTRTLRDTTRRARIALARDRTTARREIRQAAAEKARVEAVLAERREVLRSARTDLRQAIADEAMRRRAAALAARAGRANLARADRPAFTGPAPSGTANAEAAKIALSFQGVPYLWGGASPSGFDCSGLASYAYAQVGKSVPHYTVSIYNAFPRVERSDLQPGDLVFFRGLGHMGIYIGNNMMVHAPQTGDVVHVRDMSYRSDFVGAVRP